MTTRFMSLWALTLSQTAQSGEADKSHIYILLRHDVVVDMKVGLTAALDKRGFVCVWRAGQ